MALSLAVITYNEEANIVRLLDAVKGIADEIIIVETGQSKSVWSNIRRPDSLKKHLKGTGNRKIMPSACVPKSGYSSWMLMKCRTRN